jgi:hypothetical protein
VCIGRESVIRGHEIVEEAAKVLVEGLENVNRGLESVRYRYRYLQN